MLSIDPPHQEKNRKFEINQIFFQEEKFPVITRHSSQQFIPFANERDGVGRLITKQRNFRSQLNQNSKLAQKPIKQGNNPQQKSSSEEKAGRAIQCFFKKIDIQYQELHRSKTNPQRNLLVIEKKTKKKEPHSQLYDIQIGLESVKIKRKQFIIKKDEKKLKTFAKQLKIEKQENKEKNVLSLKAGLTEKRRQGSPIGQIPRYLQNIQHPQLKRFYQIKKLSMKVMDNYEVGHEKFKKKMEESKRIAQRIRKELQLE